jgi:hypothetical protein
MYNDTVLDDARASSLGRGASKSWREAQGTVLWHERQRINKDKRNLSRRQRQEHKSGAPAPFGPPPSCTTVHIYHSRSQIVPPPMRAAPPENANNTSIYVYTYT